MKKIIIVGGGAAGLFAASVIAKDNNVCVIEKNNKLGKKLYITGKGRCNITNLCDVEVLLANTLTNKNFLYSAYYTFDSSQTVSYFNSLGLKTKLERGNRVYPQSDKSSDVIKALTSDLTKKNVDVMLNTQVIDLIVKDKKVVGVLTNKGDVMADKVILSTGGLSYSMTGSEGDGFKILKKYGHNITKLYPSLVSLNSDEAFVKELMGLSLKNVSVKAIVNGKNVFEEFGEMLFTHFGVSGPLILRASSFITKQSKGSKISIDLKPALSNNELDERLLKDFSKYINKDIKNSLDDLLPQTLIPVIIKLSNINQNKKVNEITKQERSNLVYNIKNLIVNITSTRGFEEAVITKGGVDVKEVNPSTMESKLLSNLYIIGEMLDVDAFTGGFNLQIAFSTAYLCATNI